MTTTDHKRGIEAAKNILLLRAHELSAQELAEAAISAYLATAEPCQPVAVKAFGLGDRVQKTKGSSWHGRIVGFYSTELTPIGYCVESEREPGSVQIYPETVLSGGADGK